MKSGTPSEKCAVSQSDVPPNKAVICQDISVTHNDVVPQVAPNHQKVFRADLGYLAFRATPMNRYILPKHVLTPNPNTAWRSTVEAHILRSCTDDRTVADFAILADLDGSQQLSMAMNHAASTNSCATFNNCVRANLDTVGNFCQRINNSSGVYTQLVIEWSSERILEQLKYVAINRLLEGKIVTVSIAVG